MEQKKLEEIINSIVDETFKVLKMVYQNQKEGKPCRIDNLDSRIDSRIVFPRYSTLYRDGETRISEQELRFAFVEQFNKNNDVKEHNLFYSVETPTELKYSFKDKTNPKPDANGQSAMVDLAIHNENYERIALIEFKALNPDEFCYKKDFCKLTAEWENDERLTTFFVMILKYSDKGTEISVKKKMSAKHDHTHFRCYDLSKGEDITKKIIP